MDALFAFDVWLVFSTVPGDWLEKTFKQISNSKSVSYCLFSVVVYFILDALFVFVVFNLVFTTKPRDLQNENFFYVWWDIKPQLKIS